MADQEFSVEHAIILARDLRLVQLVLGRGRLRHAAFVGAASGGAWFARWSLLGLDLYIISPWALGAVLWGVLSGAFGACWGLVAHPVSGSNGVPEVSPGCPLRSPGRRRPKK